MYKSGGHNIYPREVEAVLETHTGVAHAAVVGVPDPLFQEVGAAFVVAQPESRLDAPGSTRSAASGSASYKVPKAFHVVPTCHCSRSARSTARAAPPPRRGHDAPDRERST